MLPAATALLMCVWVAGSQSPIRASRDDNTVGHTGAATAPSAIAIANCGSPPSIDLVDPETGSTRMLTQLQTCNQVALSPDGSQVAFEDKSNGLSLVNVSTGQIRQVVAPVGTARPAQAPAWSPDGKRLAFCRPDSDGPQSATFVVYIVATDGSNEHAVTDGCDPAWSPDGTKFAFTRDDGVYVSGADGSNPQRFVVVGSDVGSQEFDDGPSWSPDGTRLALRSVPAVGNDRVLVVAQLDGTEQFAVTAPASSGLIQAGSSWSPDGTRIAFTVAGSGLWTVRADGTNVHQIQGNFANVEFPSWSRSGQQQPTPLAGRYVAMGDSYSSGEGASFPHVAGCSADPYQDPTGQPANTDLLQGATKSAGVLNCYVPKDATTGDTCHRATSAYAHDLLADLGSAGRGLTLDFVACSGAVIDDFTHPYDARTGNNEHQGETAQLDHLGPDVKLVTLTIGGNDVNFAGTAKDCVQANLNPIGGVAPCFAHDATIVCTLLSPADRDCPNATVSVHERWITLLRSIRSKAPNARIVVLGYPRFFATGGNTGGCEHFTQLEEQWINDRIKLVDATLRDAVAQSGVAHFVDVFDSFAGKEECTPNPDINGINVPNGLFGTPENLHPNPSGHQDEAALLATEIRREVGLLPPVTTWTVSAGKDGSFDVHAPPKGSRFTVAVATNVDGAPAPEAITLANSTGQPVQAAVDTGTNTVWDFVSDGRDVTLHLDNSKAGTDARVALLVWASNLPTVARSAVMIPLGPNYCQSSTGANTCMDVVIAQPQSHTPPVGYVLTTGHDPLTTFDTFASATPRRIESLPCLSDPVLETKGAGGAFSSYVGFGILNCATTRAKLHIDAKVLSPGSTTTMSASGFAPNTPVAVVVHSLPIVLGTTQADGTGHVQVAIRLPSDVPTGSHTFELTGRAANGTTMLADSPHVTIRSSRHTFPTVEILASVAAILVLGCIAGWIIYIRRKQRSTSN